MQFQFTILSQIYTHTRPNKPSIEELIYYRNHLRTLAFYGHKCSDFLRFTVDRYIQDRLTFGSLPSFSLPADHPHRNLPWLDENIFHAASLVLGVTNFFLENCNEVIEQEHSTNFQYYSLHDLIELQQKLQTVDKRCVFEKDVFGNNYSENSGEPNNYLLMKLILPDLINFIQAIAYHKAREIFANTEFEASPKDIRKLIFGFSGTTHMWEDWSSDLDTSRANLNLNLNGIPPSPAPASNITTSLTLDDQSSPSTL